jgi:transcriptional regulator with GAF, ATPase, and Fis domain
VEESDYLEGSAELRELLRVDLLFSGKFNDLARAVRWRLAAAAEPAGPIYVIEKGRVRVYSGTDGQVRQLRFLREGNFFGELHHTIRTVVLFCNQEQVQPEHIVFQPDLSEVEAGGEKGTENGGFGNAAATLPALSNGDDFSLSNALRRHIRAVYEQSGSNQRQAARLLGISRGRLVRHLRLMETK